MSNNMEGNEAFQQEEVIKYNPIYEHSDRIFNRSEIQNEYLKYNYDADFDIGNRAGEAPFYLVKPNEEEGFSLRNSRPKGFTGSDVESLIEEVIRESPETSEEKKEKASKLLKDILKDTNSFRITKEGVFRVYKDKSSGEAEESKVGQAFELAIDKMLDAINNRLDKYKRDKER